MAILPICKYPDPVLAKECADIGHVDDNIRTLAQGHDRHHVRRPRRGFGRAPGGPKHPFGGG